MRALVLSGGGVAGGAWMLGLIDGLRRAGIDLGDADLVVGTSAGARVGTALATGALDDVIAMYRRSEVPHVEVPVDLGAFLAATARIRDEVADHEEATRRIANLEPLGARLVAEEERDRFVAAHQLVRTWPRDRWLVITAVDAQTGRRVAFDADSGVDMLDALAASSALPGIYPLVEIGGRRYADGGLHSLYNADLAAGYDAVTVVTPLAINPYFQSLLDAELAALGSAPARVVAADDASLAAIGPDPLSPAAAGAALEAGIGQAAREAEALGSLWHS